MPASRNPRICPTKKILFLFEQAKITSTCFEKKISDITLVDPLHWRNHSPSSRTTSSDDSNVHGKFWCFSTTTSQKRKRGSYVSDEPITNYFCWLQASFFLLSFYASSGPSILPLCYHTSFFSFFSPRAHDSIIRYVCRSNGRSDSWSLTLFFFSFMGGFCVAVPA